MRQAVSRVLSPDEPTEKLLLTHPCVSEVSTGQPFSLAFSVGDWKREVRSGIIADGPFGLLELIDNNPVVCADKVGIPSPGGTLALIALGPIVQAGLLIESPTMITNSPTPERQIEQELVSVGWEQGIAVANEDLDLGSVYAATVIAAIRTPDTLDDIDDLYDERFERSFFIRRDQDSTWDTSLVKDQPFAVYRLRIAPEEPVSLLTIQVMADRDGKCGAAQFVHAMNVMCGFEESLGIKN